MPNILRSDDFGLKIYDRFPPKYREDDVAQNFALKRYLQSLSDGGFAHVINDANGILNLVDPDNVDAKLLPILFRQYGLELFNGIPENYLRYLLPKIGEAWSRKGSLGVVEFITSAVSGVKSVPEITYDSEGNPFVSVKLEMDYNIDGSYFPEVDQLKKLLVNFIPFYCDLGIYYNYLFYETNTLKMVDTVTTSFILSCNETGRINTRNPNSISLPPAIFGRAIAGISIFGYTGDYSDAFNDYVKEMAVDECLFNTSLDTYSVIRTLDGNETRLDY